MKPELRVFNQCRIQNGYTLEEIAKKMGYSKTFIWQIVKGERKLSYENAIRLASFFGMKPDELFYEDFARKIKIEQEFIDKVTTLKH